MRGAPGLERLSLGNRGAVATGGDTRHGLHGTLRSALHSGTWILSWLQGEAGKHQISVTYLACLSCPLSLVPEGVSAGCPPAK